MALEIKVPDIGDYAEVEVIDVLVKVGDVIAKEDILITLETEKAAMDLPATHAGKITQMHVAVGDKVSKGSLILTLEPSDSKEAVETKAAETKVASQQQPAEPAKAETASTAAKPQTADQHGSRVAKLDEHISSTHAGSSIYAAPGTRRFARSLGANLSQIVGSGRKNRIIKHDVENYVRHSLATKSSAPAHIDVAAGTGFSVMPFKPVDFAKFGEIEEQPLGRIKKISGAVLHRNWVHIPHVTQFDEADITELEDFRQQQKTLAEKRGVKLTSLVFVMKAVVAGLKQFPHFNASLNVAGDILVLKKYFHIGVAVDTPDGLVVPVIRDVDRKGVLQLAGELGEISQQAREGKLTAAQMQGGCFSISSLGGIGGTAFTPIINAPEVAILGVSKSKLQPVHSKEGFIPRLMLPLSLSYDHRVIDGAEAVRFTSFLVQQLADIRHLLL